MKIVYTRWGVGNCIGGVVELNEDLKKFPKVHDEVLEHELRHLRGESHVDWNESWSWDLLKFVLSHPRCWVQYFPIWFRGGVILYDLTLLVLWSFAFLVGVVLFFAARWIW